MYSVFFFLFCVTSLYINNLFKELEVGFQSFFPGYRLQGLLRRRARDLQRHDVLGDGEVLHLSSLGVRRQQPFVCAVYASGDLTLLRTRLAQALRALLSVAFMAVDVLHMSNEMSISWHDAFSMRLLAGFCAFPAL